MITDSKYTDVQTIDEHMTKYMCYGLGIDKVLDALRLCDSKPSVAMMFWHALKAEHCSSMAKYIDPEFYTYKEMQIQQLIDLCRKWRNPRSTHIVEEKLGSNSNKNKNFVNRTSKYIFINKEDRLDFGYATSGEKWGIKYIYYFDLPGCEQISFHTDVSPQTFNGELKHYMQRWDTLTASTLMKLEYAICKKYGSLLKFVYGISDELAKDYELMLDFDYQYRLEKHSDIVSMYIHSVMPVFNKHKIEGWSVPEYTTRAALKRDYNLTDSLIDNWMQSEEVFIKNADGEYVRKVVFFVDSVQKTINDNDFKEELNKSLKRRKICLAD